MRKIEKFYWVSLAILIVLSAYPLVNGLRMAYYSVINGALEPEQYAKYVVPYAAICISLLWFAVMQPVFCRLKRFSFPVGISSAYSVFLVVERFFEQILIRTTGMTLIDTATLTPDAAGGTATADFWQAALCIVSPDMRGQALTYASQDSFFYVADNRLYKIHYYLISLILITMVCGLIDGIAKMIRNENRSQIKPLCLRGVSTATLVALCLFANTTAFFRQAADIQTPLASILTGTFFVVLGAAVGIYTGSYTAFVGKIAIGIPVLLSLCITVLMYVAESAMMGGNLYRFGVGWFFDGLGGYEGIVLAPVDIVIILLSGVVTCLILGIMQKYENLLGKRTLLIAVALCVAVAVTGPIIALTANNVADNDIRGYYVFDQNIYTNPLSSFRPFGELPYVYEFHEDTFTIAGTDSGDTHSFTARYCHTPVGADEFTSKVDFLSVGLPDLAQFKERYLIAVMTDGSGLEYGLYRMDSEIWLVELRNAGIWSIYQLKPMH